MRGGSTRTYPSFPEIEAEVGYNPARFLQTESSYGHDSIGDASELATAQALIRGIDDIDTVRAWITVEVALGRGNDGNPRQRVIKWLNQRQAELKDTQKASEPASEQEPAPADTTETTSSETEEHVTVESETGSDDDVATPATQPSTAAADATTSTATTVATDGGAAPLSDPICSECGEELIEDEVASERCYWCPAESDFREPAERVTEEQATTPTSTDSIEDEESTATTDSAEPPETPRCPDCHAELTREEVADKVAFWCSYCGGFREPQNESNTVEAVA